jgi:hypothetical protein
METLDDAVHQGELLQLARAFLDVAGPTSFTRMVSILVGEMDADRPAVGDALRGLIRDGLLDYDAYRRTVATPELVTVQVELTCPHVKRYQVRRNQIPEPGDEHSCFSSCDQVPTYRGVNPNVPRVLAVTVLDEES